MKTYLIQRCKFEDRSYKKGLDSIISLDYMGAAEFEFGALPKSLCNIRDIINSYGYNVFYVYSKPITVFCKHSQINEVQEYLDALANNSMRLHEWSDFNSYIKPSNGELEYRKKTGKEHNTDFWWDIENDIMFWKENEEFENKFQLIISIKPE